MRRVPQLFVQQRAVVARTCFGRRSIAYVNPQATTQIEPGIGKDDEAARQDLQIKQLTYNARTLVRARRHGDAEKIINEGLELYPWQSSLWFWKLATKVGNAYEAVEVWDTMGRLGVKKFPEHYDIMAAVVCYTEARHIILELYEELKSTGVVGNPKFYTQIFQACEDKSVTRHMVSKAELIWTEMQKSPELVHLTRNGSVRASRQSMLTFRASLLQARTPIQFDEATSEPTIRYRGNPEVAQPPTSTLSQAAEVPLESQHNYNTDAQPAIKRSVDDVSAPSKTGPPPPVPTQKVLRDELRSSLEPYFMPDQRGTTQHDQSLQRARSLIQATPLVSIDNYTYMIRSAARIEQPEALVELLNEAIERGLKPTSKTYAPIIRSYFDHNRPEEAIEILERMEASAVALDIKVANLVLKGLLENEREDAAITLFVDLLKGQSGVFVSAQHDETRETFNIMLNGLVDASRLVEAQKILTIMLRRNLQPSIKTYQALVRGAFGKDMVVDAMKYYDLAIRSPELQRTNFNWKVDLDELVSAVIAGYLKSHRYPEAEAFLNNAAVTGKWHKTTTKPFVYFITWLAENERLDDAWTLFEHQKTHFQGFNLFKLYNGVLKAIYLDRGDIYGGADWLRKMEQVCEISDQIPYIELLSAAMNNGERPVAEKAWADAHRFMRRTGQVMLRPLEKEGRKWGFRKLEN